MSDRARVFFIQDGGRLHYALPRALQRAGLLEAMHTDFYSRPGSVERLLAEGIGWFRARYGKKLLARFSEELDSSKILRDPLLFFKVSLSRKFLRSQAQFDRWWADEIGRSAARRGFGEANVAMGYVRNLSPAWLTEARRRGLKTVADQIIAPAAIETAETLRQHERWPGWEASSSTHFVAEQRIVERHEWETFEQLDRITCASSYVRAGLIEVGIDEDRIDVLPYPIECGDWKFVDRSNRSGPVTVGFVGYVGLRKGTPYFFETARRFDPSRVRFVMVGPVAVTANGLAHQGAVELVGGVPSSEVVRRLESFDVYYFPSTCEGSAGSLMEAMATGLPVVCSPNSGTVARDGREGFVVPYDDVDAAAERIERLVRDVELRREMGRNARARAESLGIDEYARGVSHVLEKLMNQSSNEAIVQAGARSASTRDANA
jgi:glycosyltransferase involved in cell wall biosynthesis